MKHAWLGIILLSLVTSAGAEPVAGNAPLAIPPGQSRTLTLQLNSNDPHNQVLLWVRGRLVLEQGEAWGKHALGIEVNGAPLTQRNGPLNRLPVVIDRAYSPPRTAPLYDQASGLWFLRLDSDDVPGNTRAGNPYDRTVYLDRANYTRNYRDAYDLYVFSIGGLAGSNRSHVQIRLSNASPRRSIHVSVAAVSCPPGPIWFQAQPGLKVFPWTFPHASELLAAKGALSTEAFADQFKPLVLSVRQAGTALEYAVAADALRSAAHPDVSLPVQVRTLVRRPHAATREVEYRNLQEPPLYPDLLTDADRWKIAAHSTGSAWLIVRIPPGTPPGEYESQVTLTPPTGPSLTFPLRLRVLPGQLQTPDVTFGLWDNKLPGKRNDPLALQRLEDLRQHGINTITTDPWTSPVRLRWNQRQLVVDVSALRRTLELYRAHGMNQRIFPYGTLEPLFKQARTLAAVKDAPLSADQIMQQAMAEIVRLSGELKMPLYFHPTDEPDVHPKRMPQFEQACRLIRASPGAKIWSNITATGLLRLTGLIDLDCAPWDDIQSAWLNRPVSSFFFPDWPPAQPQWIRQHVHQIYAQVRATRPDDNRRLYGLFAWYTGVKGVWGFAYSWNDKWYVAWPKPGDHGQLQSTIGWEMLRAGIDDYRRLYTLEHLLAPRLGAKAARAQVQSLLPPFEQLPHVSSARIEQCMSQVDRRIVQLSREAP